MGKNLYYFLVLSLSISIRHKLSNAQIYLAVFHHIKFPWYYAVTARNAVLATQRFTC